MMWCSSFFFALTVMVVGCHDVAPERRPAPVSTVVSDLPVRRGVPRGADTTAWPTELAAVASVSSHCTLGCPVWSGAAPTDDHVLVRSAYVAAYSPSRRVPSWVAWRVTAADIGGQPRHSGHFITDDTLPLGMTRVTHGDYAGGEYDRGHLCPSADRSSSAAANDQTFLLTNVAPMRPDLNRGPWERLEADARKRAKHDGRVVYVFAGPVWSTPTAPPATTIGASKVGVPLLITPTIGASKVNVPLLITPTIGASKVNVPFAFWKVAVVMSPDVAAAEDVTADAVVLAAVMPNEQGVSHEPWARYRANVGAVERASGYRVLTRVREVVVTALRERTP